MELNGNTKLGDLNLDYVSKESLEAGLMEVEKLYVSAYVNIGTYDFLIGYMQEEMEKEDNEDAIKQMKMGIENQKQTKLATVKMLKAHESNIDGIKELLKSKQ